MATLKVRELGDYIREQRNSSQISLRQLARLAGVSNPYLSQIERGLRKPSAEILQQIAKALRISAEVLYVQAGILEEREGGSDVPASILGDSTITERQKAVLLEIYDSFRKENEPVGGPAETDDADEPASTGAAKPTKPGKAAPATKSAGAKPRAGAKPAPTKASAAKQPTPAKKKPAAKRASQKTAASRTEATG